MSLDNVDLEGIVIWLVVGVVAGWLASSIMKSKRGGIVGYALLGIVGAIVGGFLFSLLDLGGATNLLGQIVVATIGAVIILAIVGH
ncbi:MAG TPA: GlsB/YeaQ/YmgE family stress response membrane protein [Dehalococcoidia bacterium]